jgi:hypothetical protein
MKGSHNNTIKEYGKWLQESPYYAGICLLIASSIYLLIPSTNPWLDTLLKLMIFSGMMLTVSLLTFKHPEQVFFPPLCALLIPWLIHYIVYQEIGTTVIMAYFIAAWLMTYMLVHFKTWSLVIESTSVTLLLLNIALAPFIPFFNLNILYLILILMGGKAWHEHIKKKKLTLRFSDLHISYFYGAFSTLMLIYFWFFTPKPPSPAISQELMKLFMMYLILLPYILAGTALIHQAAYKTKNRTLTLTVFYTSLIVFSSILSFALIVLGASDTVINYRKSYPKKFPKK